MADAASSPATEGSGLVNGAVSGTVVVVVSAALAGLAPETFGLTYAVLSCGLFAAGTLALLWAYLLGLSRSRTEAVSLSGLFLLGGEAAPSAVRGRFRLLVVLEVVAVVVAASARPYSELAFGVLAPTYAMGLMALWGGRHAVFAPRPPA